MTEAESLAIVIDGRILQTYAFGQPGWSGGTEQYIRTLAHGLAEHGHLVHVVTSDLTHEEFRGPREIWWGPETFPKAMDVLVPVGNLQPLADYPRLPAMVVLASNGVDPDLAGLGGALSAVACFSQTHADLLCKVRPEVRPEQCHITGLGVDLADYPAKRAVKPVKGRMLYGNDPTRGLWHVLDIFDVVKKAIPEATLHVTYDFERQFENSRWSSHAIAELMWDCKRRIETTPGVASLGALSHEDLLREQFETDVYAYPSDPLNVGSQIHGLLQMELAAAGVPLVLSDIEAFPEVFGSCADGEPVARILPLPNTLARAGTDAVERITAQDWAEVVVELMRSPKKHRAAAAAGRRLAEQHTWAAMTGRWLAMLDSLVAGLTLAA